MTKPLPPLTAPAHLCGTFRPATPIPLIRERALFVVAAMQAGYRQDQIAGSLGITTAVVSIASRKGRVLVQQGHTLPDIGVDKPQRTDREQIVVHRVSTNATNISSTVSVPRAPWPEAFAGHDPRDETRPRLTLVRVPKRQPSIADLFIEEVARMHAEGAKSRENGMTKHDFGPIDRGMA